MSIASKIEVRKRELRYVQASLDSLSRRAQETPDLWKQFLDEKYDGGKKQVPNPNPNTKESHPKVSVSTIMSSPDSSGKAMKDKIRKEFQAWSEKHPAVKDKKKTLLKDVSAEGSKLNLNQSQLGKLEKVLSGEADVASLKKETAKLVEETNNLHKKHLHLGDDPDKESHPKADQITKLMVSLNKGKGKTSLDAISKAVGPSLGAEGTKAVVDWVKSTVLHQAMKDLAANKDIKPI